MRVQLSLTEDILKKITSEEVEGLKEAISGK
jgi:hypothetical protein